MNQEIMEAFTSMKSDQEIGMPDIEQELVRVKAQHQARRPKSMWRKVAASVAVIVTVCGLALAAVVYRASVQPAEPTAAVEAPSVPAELLIVPNDSVETPSGIIRFDNAELVDIMTSISNAYQREVVFSDEQKKHIRLHFQYNTTYPLTKVVEALNTFEKIQVSCNDKRLEVK